MKEVKNICSIILLILMFATINSSKINAQISEDLKEVFNDGVYFVNFGDYREALFNFTKLYNKGIKNGNIQYYIGFCYINMPNEKTKAIPYLEEAIKSVSINYTEGNFKEITAPVHAYYYLGVAYHVNYEFEKAKENYRKFIALLPTKEVSDLKYAKKQIEACNKAPEYINNPKPYTFERLSDKINNNSPNLRPVVSGNDSTFVFMTQLKFYDGVFVSNRNNKGEWTSPKNINPELRSDGKLQVNSISYKGDMLLFSLNDNFKSDIYSSTLDVNTGKWAPITKMKTINSVNWESHATISADGKAIYFVSSRKQTVGGSDIFVTKLNDNGKWSKPVNLGSTINTIFNEETPFITENGKILFFSSQGHDGLGGFDVYMSVLNGHTWSKPINLGYPVNTPDDDLFFYPINDGEAGYYSRFNTETPSMREDIYIVKLR
jgi:hypothetical protein